MRIALLQKDGDCGNCRIERKKSHLEYYNNGTRRVERMSMAFNGKGEGYDIKILHSVPLQ